MRLIEGCVKPFSVFDSTALLRTTLLEQGARSHSGAVSAAFIFILMKGREDIWVYFQIT